MHSFYLARIKSFEGFTARAKHDYSQYSNGYGTKALYAGEMIDRGEAERRFKIEIAEARRFVDRNAADCDEGTKAALTSLTYNAGTKWVSSGLGHAVRNGDTALIKERFLQYTKAGGVDLPGLIIRRLVEASWIGNPQQSFDASPRPTPEPPAAAMAIALAQPNIERSPAEGRLDGAESNPRSSGTRLAAPTSAPLLSVPTSAGTAFAVAMLALEIKASRNAELFSRLDRPRTKSTEPA